MSTYTSVPQGGALAHEVWRKVLVHEVELDTPELQHLGESEDSGIVLMNELARTRGEKITYRFSPTDDSEDGFLEQDQKTGNEHQSGVLQNSMFINYLALSEKHPGPMSTQRANIDWRELMYTKLAARWKRRFSQWFHYQAAGATYADTAYPNLQRQGLNAVTAVDEAHVMRPSAVANDQSLGSGNILTLALISDIVSRVGSRDYFDWPIAPCSDGLYHFYMSQVQAQQLRSSTTTNEWADIVGKRIQGGESYDSSAWRHRHLGIYANVALHVSDFVVNGVHSGTGASVANTRRAIFLGAGGMRLAFGEGFADGDHLDWIEQKTDYDKMGVIAPTIAGMVRSTFTPVGGSETTAGIVVVPTYSAVA